MVSPIIAVGEVRLGHRPSGDSLFEEPAKNKPAAARSEAVESEGELLQLSLQVGGDP